MAARMCVGSNIVSCAFRLDRALGDVSPIGVIGSDEVGSHAEQEWLDVLPDGNAVGRVRDPGRKPH